MPHSLLSRASYLCVIVVLILLPNSLTVSAVYRVIDLPSKEPNTGDTIEYPSLRINNFTLVLREGRGQLASHECDSILAGKDDDGCITRSGCKLLEKRMLKHSIWGANTYLCVGELDPVSGEDITSSIFSRIGTYSGDSKTVVYPPVVYEARYVGASYSAQSSSTKFTIDGSLAYDYIRFIDYHDGVYGIIGGDCLRDISYDIEEASKGEIVGEEYRYIAEGIDPKFCTREVSLANYEFFCRTLRDRLGLSVDVPCHVLFSPLFTVGAVFDVTSSETWHSSLPTCGDGGRENHRLSSSVAIEHHPDILGSSKMGNATLVPCRLEAPRHVRSLPLQYVDHSMMSGAVHLLGRVLHELMVRVIEPVIKEILRVVWTIVWYLVIEPLGFVIGSIIDNTASFLFTVAACGCLTWYTYRRIQKLTSSGIYIVCERDDDNSVYKSTTKPFD